MIDYDTIGNKLIQKQKQIADILQNMLVEYKQGKIPEIAQATEVIKTKEESSSPVNLLQNIQTGLSTSMQQFKQLMETTIPKTKGLPFNKKKRKRK